VFIAFNYQRPSINIAVFIAFNYQRPSINVERENNRKTLICVLIDKVCAIRVGQE